MKHNQRERKHRPVGIRRKLTVYLAIFTVALFATLYLTQTVFLDDLYRAMKRKEPLAAAQAITAKLGTDALDEAVSQQREQYQLCIDVLDSSFLSVCGERGICYSSGTSSRCFLHEFSTFGQRTYLTKLKTESGGSYFGEYRIGSPFDSLPKTDGVDNGAVWLYVAPVTGADGAQYYIVISTMITPVSAAARTLRSELLVAMVLFIAAAVIMGLVLARSISKPLEQINTQAEKLGRGQYDIACNSTAYKEVAQLGDTLNSAARELEQTDALRRELVANISHDLRTPLTMIRGYAEMMRDLPGENTPQNMQVIIDEATRLGNLVNDLLDLSKLEAGTTPLCPAVFSITDCVRAIIDRCAKMTQAQGYRIDYQCDCPQATVYADRTRIEQVIYNLLGNAINYTGADMRVLVRQTLCADGSRVHIDVIDTGSGISKENLNRIWDRYYKENKAHRRAAIGTGLGLSIVKQILEQHGAHYGVLSEESPAHHGSCFWFELELAEKPKTK